MFWFVVLGIGFIFAVWWMVFTRINAMFKRFQCSDPSFAKSYESKKKSANDDEFWDAYMDGVRGWINPKNPTASMMGWNIFYENFFSE